MNSAQNVIGELRKLGVPIDISANKLLPGFGEGVCSVLFALCDMSIKNRVKFKKPVIRDEGGGFGGDDDADELGDELEGNADVADMNQDADDEIDGEIDDEFEFGGQMAGGGQVINEEDML